MKTPFLTYTYRKQLTIVNKLLGLLTKAGLKAPPKEKVENDPINIMATALNKIKDLTFNQKQAEKVQQFITEHLGITIPLKASKDGSVFKLNVKFKYPKEDLKQLAEFEYAEKREANLNQLMLQLKAQVKEQYGYFKFKVVHTDSGISIS